MLTFHRCLLPSQRKRVSGPAAPPSEMLLGFAGALGDGGLVSATRGYTSGTSSIEVDWFMLKRGIYTR